MTCTYPPPHMTCMYPPPHMTCMYTAPTIVPLKSAYIQSPCTVYMTLDGCVPHTLPFNVSICLVSIYVKSVKSVYIETKCVQT